MFQHRKMKFAECQFAKPGIEVSHQDTLTKIERPNRAQQSTQARKIVLQRTLCGNHTCWKVKRDSVTSVSLCQRASKLDNHVWLVALYTGSYNWIKTHKTLRYTGEAGRIEQSGLHV